LRPAGRLAVSLLLAAALSLPVSAVAASRRAPQLTARAAIIIDNDRNAVLFSKNPHLKLPPASTTKVMTALLALERLPLYGTIPVSRHAAGVEPSKAGLTPDARYRVKDLILATIVSSSNDAAVALAEAMGGSESGFAVLMNRKAASLGMRETFFVNSTGLPEKKKRQYSTAYDLTILMRRAAKDPRFDQMMGVTTAYIYGSDKKSIFLKSHNKMLWKMPKFVKGKTGWTFASRHTFVGTDYSSKKEITFAMLASQKPWIDIERLATFGFMMEKKK
jgi:D-alanyl-D-alanine carboxypeptidase (penicillin-binding protein 5/6)